MRAVFDNDVERPAFGSQADQVFDVGLVQDLDGDTLAHEPQGGGIGVHGGYGCIWKILLPDVQGGSVRNADFEHPEGLELDGLEKLLIEN